MASEDEMDGGLNEHGACPLEANCCYCDKKRARIAELERQASAAVEPVGETRELSQMAERWLYLAKSGSVLARECAEELQLWIQRRATPTPAETPARAEGEPCIHVNLIKQVGPMDGGAASKRYRCKGCSMFFYSEPGGVKVGLGGETA